MRKGTIVLREMARYIEISPNLEREELKLSLLMLRRPSDVSNNTELSSIARTEEREGRMDTTAKPRPGEFRTVPYTMTNVEGIGRVDYGTTSFIVTSEGVEIEKRAVFGEHLSGVMTFNDHNV